MRPVKYKPGTIILIQWDDILSDSKWTNESSDKNKPILVRTVGIFIKTYVYNRKKALKICHSITEDGEYDTTDIPWSVIRSIHVLGDKDGSDSQSDSSS